MPDHDPLAQWWEDDAQRLNALADSFRAKGQAIVCNTDQPRDDLGRWVAVLSDLHERAGSSATTHSEIERTTKGLDAEPKDLVFAVHKAMGFHSKPKSKSHAVQMIHDRISERLGRSERGDEIDRVARGE